MFALFVFCFVRSPGHVVVVRYLEIDVRLQVDLFRQDRQDAFLLGQGAPYDPYRDVGYSRHCYHARPTPFKDLFGAPCERHPPYFLLSPTVRQETSRSFPSLCRPNRIRPNRDSSERHPTTLSREGGSVAVLLACLLSTSGRLFFFLFSPQIVLIF